MRARDLATFVTLTLLVCVLFSVTNVTAGKKTFGLNGHVSSVEFSKSVPNQLNYQGYLVDSSDSSAVTATLEMTFRLYDAEVGGSEQWSETHPAVEVRDGLFHALLGSVTPFPGGLFDGSTLWLQTEVGVEALTPRKPLVSVAYSHRTHEADHATTAEYATDAQHAVHADTAGYCPGISAWIVDGDNVYRVTGNVGIGTSSPGRQLHIYDDTDAATATIETGGATNSWAQTRYKTASKEWIVGTSRDYNDNELYIDDGSSALHLNADGTNGFRVSSDGGKYLSLRTGSTDAVYISSAGHVGIATTSPMYPLHVDGIASTEGLWLPGAFGPDTSYVGEDGNWIAFGHPGASEDFLGYKGNAFYFMDSPGGADTTAADVIIGGKVGIGTTSPGYALDVNGDVNATTYWGDGSNLTGIAGTPDADWTISGSDMYSGVSGNVGIGASIPSYKLHVIADNHELLRLGTIHANSHINILAGPSGAGGLQIKAIGGNNHIALFPGSTERARFTQSGKVGIGTTSPAKLLDVAGGVRADTLSLGSSSKAGVDGQFSLYRDGSVSEIMVAENYGDYGGMIDLYDEEGHYSVRLEPDVNGTGGFLEVERSDAAYGFMVDGNSGGTEEPWVAIRGSARSVDFYMSRPGDSSVVLPTGAVSADEIKDEPGVSNSLGADYIHMNSGNNYVIDSVDIDIPDAGYVEVTAGCYLNLFHTKGTNTAVWVAIDKTPQSVNYTYPGAQSIQVPDSMTTSSQCWQFPCTTTRLYEEGSAGPKRYYLNARYANGISGVTNVAWAYIRAKYYPTLYGSVTMAETEGFDPVVTGSQNQGDGSEPTVEPRRRTITVEDHNARLEEKLQALRAELEALREEVQNQRR